MLWPTKNHTMNLITKKKFLRLENSPPAHNFSNGPSLSFIFSERAASANEVARALSARAAQSLIKS